MSKQTTTLNIYFLSFIQTTSVRISSETHNKNYKMNKFNKFHSCRQFVSFHLTVLLFYFYLCFTIVSIVVDLINDENKKNVVVSQHNSQERVYKGRLMY